MNKTQIKALIEKGIKGQGTNIDGGGYLGQILDAITDLIPEEIPYVPEGAFVNLDDLGVEPDTEPQEISKPVYLAISGAVGLVYNNSLWPLLSQGDLYTKPNSALSLGSMLVGQYEDAGLATCIPFGDIVTELETNGEVVGANVIFIFQSVADDKYYIANFAL